MQFRVWSVSIVAYFGGIDIHMDVGRLFQPAPARALNGLNAKQSGMRMRGSLAAVYAGSESGSSQVQTACQHMAVLLSCCNDACMYHACHQLMEYCCHHQCYDN